MINGSLESSLLYYIPGTLYRRLESAYDRFLAPHEYERRRHIGNRVPGLGFWRPWPQSEKCPYAIPINIIIYVLIIKIYRYLYLLLEI